MTFERLEAIRDGGKGAAGCTGLSTVDLRISRELCREVESRGTLLSRITFLSLELRLIGIVDAMVVALRLVDLAVPLGLSLELLSYPPVTTDALFPCANTEPLAALDRRPACDK